MTVVKVPVSLEDSMENCPWCASTIRFTMGNPRPVPVDFVVKKGLVSWGNTSAGIGSPPL